MHCSSCVMLLEGIADEVDGISIIRADFRKQRIEVEYDETNVSQEQVVEAVKKEGFVAVLLETKQA